MLAADWAVRISACWLQWFIMSGLLLSSLCGDAPLRIHFIEDGTWNPYCNSSSYASISGDDTSVILSVSNQNQGHRLYGGCSLKLENRNSQGVLYFTFLEYAALLNCAGGTLAFYENVNAVDTLLWEGRCGDATHLWKPRKFQSQTSSIWVWYEKSSEWPENLPYSEMNFNILITTQPILQTCDNSQCSKRGQCTIRGDDPPTNLTSFAVDRQIWVCHCAQPYEGTTCSEVNFPENSCTAQPCLNDGSCVLDSTRSSGYYCDCKHPYTGEHCEFNSAMCLDSDLCGTNGTCKVVQGVVSCHCDPYWIGSRCDIISPCYSQPCHNGGICITPSLTEFVCICTGMWTGVVCSELMATLNRERTTHIAVASSPVLDEQAKLSSAGTDTNKRLTVALVSVFIVGSLAVLALVTMSYFWRTKVRRYKRQSGAEEDNSAWPVLTNALKILNNKAKGAVGKSTNQQAKMTAKEQWSELRKIIRYGDTLNDVNFPSPALIAELSKSSLQGSSDHACISAAHATKAKTKMPIGSQRFSSKFRSDDGQKPEASLVGTMPEYKSEYNKIDSFNFKRKGTWQSDAGYGEGRTSIPQRDDIRAHRKEMASRFYRAHVKRHSAEPAVTPQVNHTPVLITSDPSLVKDVPSYPLIGKEQVDTIPDEEANIVTDNFRTKMKDAVTKLVTSNYDGDVTDSKTKASHAMILHDGTVKDFLDVPRKRKRVNDRSSSDISEGSRKVIRRDYSTEHTTAPSLTVTQH